MSISCSHSNELKLFFAQVSKTIQSSFPLHLFLRNPSKRTFKSCWYQLLPISYELSSSDFGNLWLSCSVLTFLILAILVERWICKHPNFRATVYYDNEYIFKGTDFFQADSDSAFARAVREQLWDSFRRRWYEWLKKYRLMKFKYFSLRSRLDYVP